MYNTYLWKIKPLSSQMTPWQSDTIYGHLLYGASLLYGDEFVKKLIDEFSNIPPFIVSDGFIDGQLPMINKGTVKRSDTEEFAKIYGKNQIETVKKLKEINKIKFIPIEDFNKLREKNYNKKDFIISKLQELNKEEENANSIDFKSKKLDKKDTAIQETLVMHNTINRIMGSTGDNGVFALKETFIEGNIFIFIKIRKDFDINILDTLLKFVEKNGYGKKVSSGKGAIERVSFEKYNEFNEVKNGNGFIVLSNYIPKEFDYEEVISANYLVKKGKVYGDIDFPFKKPFSCFTAGSLFKKSKNSIYGKVLKDIHIDKNIVQIGIPFTLEVEL
ncbi:MAG: hypothetical protein MR673_04275 [Fusobacterium perfoetens]|uniref:type III-A CRISPR-associated RAMP protein Csm4 n=1 Tax=Fusobacterium perfoetens TaxID=852 RepID=UPI0023F35F30|nr:hypothetical protein [Fusobacterium perfoetens]MCI6152329.1 hypothetical protein [Fusobacterium perfoetens]MDY3238187.1 hypothetical protein [Fusobacterium perfoetens]